MILGPLYQEGAVCAPRRLGGVFRTRSFLSPQRKKRTGSIFQEKKEGKVRTVVLNLTQKISAISCPSRQILPPERSLRSAHRLSVQLHSKTNAFGLMKASAPTRKFPKIGRTICPPKFFLPFFDAICYDIKL